MYEEIKRLEKRRQIETAVTNLTVLPAVWRLAPVPLCQAGTFRPGPAGAIREHDKCHTGMRQISSFKKT